MLNIFKYLLIRLIKLIIFLIEKYEYRKLLLNPSDASKKILKSIDIVDLKVKTDTGYAPVTDLHLTQPYNNYILETKDYTLSCADRHIVFDKDYNEVFVENLKVGDLIQTETGVQSVKSLKLDKFKSSMFDLTVDNHEHRFYTNKILSHNTISASIFMLHTIIFKNDKNIMIVANKGDTAIEIVDKIKSIYTMMPFFLKPGVKTWNQKSLTFENGCRIKISARTKTPAIGFTIDVLYLDEFAHIPSTIIEPYYTAAFPTVSAIQNSKIIITSTPNGMNLFHKLLTNAERPDGDPLKNNYIPMRVYWYQVPGRFVTYIRLNGHNLHENKLTKQDVFNLVKSKWGDITRVEMVWNNDIQKDIINVYNNDLCKDIDIKQFKFENGEGLEISLHNISEVTTWKEEAIKDIGGEDAFNQEYGLRFINASKSLLNEAIIDKLIKDKKNYKFFKIDEFEKLRFSYKDLKWIEDDNIFLHEKRKNYKVILSVDLSEGLGQDYSVINIFKISEKSKEVIEEQKVNYKSMVDLFKLDQIGIFRSNIISIGQIAEFLYILAFEYFNPDNLKIVLEINNYGNTLLAEMPHVFDGENQYGSYVFLRYKHRLDSQDLKLGLKVGENKNLMVKDYQDLMYNKSFNITNVETIGEITTFVKHTTSSGNIRYAADGGNDDIIMTVVNATSIFKKNEFRQMVEDYMEYDMSNESKLYIQDFLGQLEYIESTNYSEFLEIRKNAMSEIKYNNQYKSNVFKNNGGYYT